MEVTNKTHMLLAWHVTPEGFEKPMEVTNKTHVFFVVAAYFTSATIGEYW